MSKQETKNKVEGKRSRLLIRSDRFPVFRSRATAAWLPLPFPSCSLFRFAVDSTRERESILYHAWLGKRKGTRFAPNFCFNSVNLYIVAESM